MANMALDSTAGGGPAGFASTQWGMLLAAAGGAESSGDARAAWEQLYRSYGRPVYTFIRRRGRSRPAAQDLTQDFFVHLVEKGALRRADPTRGRFRTFLLGVLEYFLVDGRGAMGVTYRAIDTTLRREAALKVINLDLAAHPRARTRFLREAQEAAGLRHPHIATVFFFGERSGIGQPFYAMELVEGETLQARVRRCGGLPAEAALEIGAQVADALAAAEAAG